MERPREMSVQGRLHQIDVVATLVSGPSSERHSRVPLSEEDEDETTGHETTRPTARCSAGCKLLLLFCVALFAAGLGLLLRRRHSLAAPSLDDGGWPEAPPAAVAECHDCPSPPPPWWARSPPPPPPPLTARPPPPLAASVRRLQGGSTRLLRPLLLRHSQTEEADSLRVS